MISNVASRVTLGQRDDVRPKISLMLPVSIVSQWRPGMESSHDRSKSGYDRMLKPCDRRCRKKKRTWSGRFFWMRVSPCCPFQRAGESLVDVVPGDRNSQFPGAGTFPAFSEQTATATFFLRICRRTCGSSVCSNQTRSVSEAFNLTEKPRREIAIRWTGQKWTFCFFDFFRRLRFPRH